MVGLLEAFRYSYGWTVGGPRYWYGRNLGGPPVFVWLDSLRTPGFRIVELFEVSRFSHG